MFEQRGDKLVYKNITVVPSIHARAAFALETRRLFLSDSYDCIAVELPESLGEKVAEGVEELPEVHVVVYRDNKDNYGYVPIDPCDSIIEGVRLGVRDRRCRLAFIDTDVANLNVAKVTLPDEYAALKIGIPTYYQAVAPHIDQAAPDSVDDVREKYMAYRLQQLSAKHKKVLFICGLRHVESIGRYLEKPIEDEPESGELPTEVFLQPLHKDSLYHILGELPYNTWLYEQIRYSITLEEYEPIFGLKNLLMAARERYHAYFKDDIHRISPQSLQQMLTYIRNLCLMSGYLTPSLYDIAVAAKGIGGDSYAVHLLEVARCYGELPPPEDEIEEDEDEEIKDLEPEAKNEETVDDDEDEAEPYPWEDPSPPWASPTYSFEHERADPLHGPTEMQMTEDQGLIDGRIQPMKRRLPGVPKIFRKLKLEKTPSRKMRKSWKQAWDDRRAVSWPPEDEIVEGFADYVRKRALKMTSLSMLRSEEFSSSLMDGLHVKETLRNVHLNKLYVKVEPRVTGQVGAVVIIFEDDNDDDRFPWKITWYAEHENESTLSFYATPYQENIVGPGVGRALYGGTLFLYPPKSIPDVWTDRSLEKAQTSMERLVFGAAVHAHDKYIAYVAPKRPSPRMKQFCDMMGRKLIYLPVSSFSRTTLWKMRTFHVLNGRHVRSWASKYIR
ncbi:MAG: hypothetical protein P1V97_16775 [Planctomycetota bacterium]|nr:hypothetical protein [Planctomycetota bacterium]